MTLFKLTSLIICISLVGCSDEYDKQTKDNYKKKIDERQALLDKGCNISSRIGTCWKGYSCNINVAICPNGDEFITMSNDEMNEAHNMGLIK